MVRIVIFIVLQLFWVDAICQTIGISDSTTIIFSEPECIPEYKGGHQGLLYFISNNIKYPITAIEDSIEGNVFVNFIVDTNGFTKNHKVIDGIREDLNKEAIRIAELIKFEKPAMNGGRAVFYSYSLSIKFFLSPEMVTFIEEAPLFNGDLNEFIQNEIVYPLDARKDTIEGTVIISFKIDTLGLTNNHEVVKGIREDVNNEALRIAKLIKFDRPALQKGKPITVEYTVPIVFDLLHLNNKSKCNRK
jgi:protein TonB